MAKTSVSETRGEADNIATGPYTRRLAEFAATHDDSELSAQAISNAKEIILDTAGAMLLGSAPGYKSYWLTGELARQTAGRPECTIVGRDFKASLLDAALVNGVAGYSADAEGGWIVGLHAAAVLVPAVLTVGEYAGATGQQMIAALGLGFEFMARVWRAANTGGHYPHAFHPSAVYGHFGAAAVAGHLLGLDEAQWVNALGLAGINATGMIAWVDDPSEDSRAYVIGVAVQSGVRAALLASMGMGGPLQILDDAKYSIYEAYTGGMNLDRLVEGLGEMYWMERAFGAKQHPCCGDITSGVDALLEIRAAHQLQAEDIEGITHWVRARRVKVIDNNPLKSHNSQYIMSVAAARGKIAPQDILVDQRAADPQVARLWNNARLLPEPNLDAIEGGAPAIVEVVLRDGSRLQAQVDYPKGYAENPFSREELRSKFLDWATTRISREQAQRVIELVENLEMLDDAAELVRLLGTQEPPPSQTS
jgi:2-methylcitrate dehydratase PrpD